MTQIDTIVVAARARQVPAAPTSAAEAVAITEGKILAVGTKDDILALAGPETVIREHPGATIIPGLVDAHSHPIYSLGIVRGLSLTEVHTRAELLDTLERGAADRDGNEWFLAWGLDPSAFEGEPVSNAELHRVLGRHRLAYVKMFDAHSGIASDAALAAAGIDRPITLADGSGAAGDEHGVLTGHLIEFPTMEKVERLLPVPSAADRVDQLRTLLSEMAAVGITSAHVMDLKDADALDLLAAIEAEGELPVRLRISPWCTPETTDAEVADLVALQGTGGRRYRVEGIKLFIDGTVEGGTAWLADPDRDGEGTSSVWEPAATYAARVAHFHRLGIPTATHAIGDRGVRVVADTLAALPASGVTHRIEHLETTEDDVIDLIGRSGIVASMQPTHCTHHVRADGSDEWSQRLGTIRAARAWRTADVRRSGAVLALGSDWPVAAFDPWEIMADAQARRSVRGTDTAPVGADQALSASEVLEGYTHNGHRAAGADGGRLVAGESADLVVVDVDPLTATPEELARARVLLTMVEGVATHEAH